MENNHHDDDRAFAKGQWLWVQCFSWRNIGELWNTIFGAVKENVCVVEADEYDRSFLKLSPDVAVISSMDPDHLDIYGTAEAMEEAFIDFSQENKTGRIAVKQIWFKKRKGSEGRSGI